VKRFNTISKLRGFYWGMACWFDPFIDIEDNWMKGIDRDELKLEKKYFRWLDR
jgi:hypothetical protein